MHYDFKKKLNKVDSQKYRNFLIPEIDWVLNEACELYIKFIAEPRLRNHLGFEVNQRTIDDIKSLVKNQNDSVNQFNIINSEVTLPTDYLFYISSHVLMSKGECSDVVGKVFIRQHDDLFEISPFDKSSFEWRTVNAVFFENGLKFFSDGSFDITKFCLSYIRKPVYMHNAEDFRNGEYSLPSGILLSNTQDCDLPDHTHREIVDLAVMITSGEISDPNFQTKQLKTKLNFN